MYQPYFMYPVFSAIGIVVILWTLPWKIYAVWLAAKHDQKKWFVALIVLNTLAILEIIYVFHILKKTWPEVKADFRHAWDSITK
jgi:hypothetical protein